MTLLPYLADVIKVMDPEIERIFWIIQILFPDCERERDGHVERTWRLGSEMVGSEM